MSYTVDTGKVLDAIRDALGASVTVGAVTYTWQWKPEGPAVRWLATLADYPSVTLEVGEVAVIDGAAMDTHHIPVTITPIFKLDLDPAVATYKETRELGEAVVNALMSAATRIGNNRRLMSYGVDTDLMAVDHYFDEGFGIYRIELEVECMAEDRNP